MEEVNTIKASSNTEIDSFRAKNLELQSLMDKTQQNFYEAGSDISRKEQELNLQKEKNKLITTELDELKKSLLLKISEANDLKEGKE